MTYTPAHVRMPERSVINLKNVSSEITAEIVVGEDQAAEATAGATGVIACQGGNMAGWSLYLDADGRPTYLYNCFGHDLTFVTAPDALAAGHHTIRVLYLHDGGFGAGGEAILFVDDDAVGQARLDRTVPVVFSMSGETFDVGIDTGAPVGPYEHGFACSAEIIGVTLERLTEPDAETRKAMLDGEIQAGLRAQ